MDEQSLKVLWAAYDKKLEKSLSINLKSIEEVQKLKAKSALRSAKGMKIFALLVGLLWLPFLGFLIYHSLEWSKVFFVVSAGIHFIVSLIAMIIYVHDLVLIHEIDHSENVINVQQKLAKLQASTLRVARLLFLQLPVWTTFTINPSMLQNGSWPLWIFQLLITGLFTYAGIWLYRNINFKNKDKRWFRFLFGSPEWTAVLKALDFMEEIERYKRETVYG